MGRSERYKKKRKRKRALKILLAALAVFLIAGGIFIFKLFNDVRTTINDDLHEDVSTIDTDETKEKVDKKEPINILLLGVDERENDVGRSDTMIVMTLDPNNNQMQMVSIPRDTRVEIAGDGRTTRINHAYAYGGSDMAVDTVENFLDIDLDYYIKVNMEGLSQLVNAVNGVTVQNDRAFSAGGHSFKEGTIELNGEEALAFVRMRKNDPSGDLGRNERQRQVIQGIIDKGASIGVVNKIGDILDVLGDNVNTNMQFEDMRRLAANYRSARQNTSSYQMSGEGRMINGMYLMIMSDQEIQKTHDMIVDFGSN
ncbi:transcriptional regulator LytR [Halobacillus halophilus]|uniref:LytR family transcription regulator n=1 Tax=Halobacillus halophilus (strain ATCC 35676 / DSM 2266 / JCM 20832 / KCTC 3685 / LMG 17431 / NBRC 102448 / NCIMB 2269) TaxID=866895 RepID=I0JRW0_HALH3|nr:LCP family protein [Halobacillus halophilus]ASF40833.1 transcriptional regulator LytR [Halobacillus halophilus]CCG46881.1 LytR family transcription regulator [Halobacillus halophilus DSM 2266]